MPQLTPYTDADLELWGLIEDGVRHGESPTIIFDKNGAVGVRKFRCLWEHRYSAVRYFLGDVSSYDDAGVERVSRLLPQALPDRPTFYATRLAEPIRGYKWAGRDDPPETEVTEDDAPWTDTSIARYTHALLTVQYERVPFNVVSDASLPSKNEGGRFVQFIPGEGSIDYLTRPAGTQFYLTPDATPPHNISVPFATGVVDPVIRFQLKWHRIPGDQYGPGTILWARLHGDGTNPPWLGSVNRTPFLGLTVGTVLLENYQPFYAPSVLGDSNMDWDLLFHLAHKPIGGWNQSWWFPSIGEFAFPPRKVLVGATSTYPVDGLLADWEGNYNFRNWADPDHGLFSIG